MLLIIICYFYHNYFWPWPWPQPPEIGLGLEVLASFNITVISRFHHCTGSWLWLLIRRVTSVACRLVKKDTTSPDGMVTNISLLSPTLDNSLQPQTMTAVRRQLQYSLSTHNHMSLLRALSFRQRVHRHFVSLLHMHPCYRALQNKGRTPE